MKQLYNKKWYTPREIARLGLIKNSKGDGGTLSGNYSYVLKLIKSGRLKAKVYSVGKIRPSFLVSESAIEQYHNTEDVI